MRHSLKKSEQTQGQCHGTGEEPDSIAANITTLPWTDSLACLLCTPSHEVEGSITSDEYLQKLEGFVRRRTVAVMRLNNQSQLVGRFNEISKNYK